MCGELGTAGSSGSPRKECPASRTARENELPGLQQAQCSTEPQISPFTLTLSSKPRQIPNPMSPKSSDLQALNPPPAQQHLRGRSQLNPLVPSGHSDCRG